MAVFNFNAYGHDFERGLMILRDSLTAALQALDQQAERISAEYAAYEDSIEKGADRTGEWDHDSDTWVWEQSQFYEYDLELVEETKSAIRKTHATAIYHLWERIVRHWTGTHGHENHDALAVKAAEHGLVVHDRMKVISHLNNALKHSSQRFGPQLLEAWPDVFPPGYAQSLAGQKERAVIWKSRGMGNGEVRPDWFDAITLTDAHMDIIFDAVRSSGPRANTPG